MEPDRIIKQIKLIFWAIFGTLTATLITILFMVDTFGPLMDWTLSHRESFKSVILILSLGGIPASYFFHNKKVKHIPGSMPLLMKLRQYRSSIFIKLATLEGLSFLPLTGYLLTADKTFLYVFALLFITFSISMPSKRNILNELEEDQK